uniref:Pecanex-like protein n=1 Tax=Angiostrongylus cantonensis TaxID=6313 RepID=A0A0K0DCE8_ANGCA
IPSPSRRNRGIRSRVAYTEINVGAGDVATKVHGNELTCSFQEVLFSSPAHFLSFGSLPADQLSASWEQWLCYLASSLTPQQWQGYWAAHVAMFGLRALPVHLCSFFNQSIHSNHYFLSIRPSFHNCI